METYDYIIVGGSAGRALANRLSRDPATRVLLLEAGGRDNYHWIHIPVGYLHCIGNPRTDWMYRTASEPGLGGRSLIYPRGRALGGCSSINGMIYMRGQREDYDQWAALSGDEAWSWDRVLPVFKRSEDHHRGASEHHGAGGEWRVESQRLRWISWKPSPRRRTRPASRRWTISTAATIRQRLLRSEPARRLALEHLQGLPAAGAPARQSSGADRCPRA